MDLQGYNSLNLIWFIHSIYLRPFLQNVHLVIKNPVRMYRVFYGLEAKLTLASEAMKYGIAKRSRYLIPSTRAQAVALAHPSVGA
jgi:hypothetical protein